MDKGFGFMHPNKGVKAFSKPSQSGDSFMGLAPSPVNPLKRTSRPHGLVCPGSRCPVGFTCLLFTLLFLFSLLFYRSKQCGKRKKKNNVIKEATVNLKEETEAKLM